MTRMILLISLLPAVLAGQQPETLSLLGEPLRAPKLSKEDRAAADEAMRVAHAQYEKTPNDVPSIVALAQAHLAFGRVGDAVEILTRGLEVQVDEARLLAERGRGFVLLRKFELAQRDLRKAVEKVPEAHCSLGLAQYLAGAYPHAQASYAKCADPGIFGYLAARRAGATVARPDVAGETTRREQDVRLPGSVTPKRTTPHGSLSADYLAAAELIIDGKKDEATARLKTIVEKNRNAWMDPIYIAAEADYARLYKPPRKRK